MKRREFLTAAVSGGMLAAISSAAHGQVQAPDAGGKPKSQRFGMKFAPHFGMFRHSAGEDPVEQLKFAADQGFTAWEDNGMKGRSIEDQNRIAKAMQDLGMEMVLQRW